MDKHTAYFHISEGLPQRGCVICRLGHQVEVKYIHDVLYSKTTSIQTRGELRQSRGFCPFHARQLDEIGHALDLSIVYQDVLMTLRQILERPSPQQAVSRRGKRQLSSALGSEAACPACTYRGELETVYVETFADHLVDPEFVAQVRAADPLCLGHYQQIILQDLTAVEFEALRDIQLVHWENLIGELGEFIRKHDHRFRHETMGAEGTAWIRTIDAIVGTRKL